MVLSEIFEKVKSEHARSMNKHGKWTELSDIDQLHAIHAEFREWNSAWLDGDIHGEHGEIAELVQVMNVCARRIMFLTGEDQ